MKIRPHNRSRTDKRKRSQGRIGQLNKHYHIQRRELGQNRRYQQQEET